MLFCFNIEFTRLESFKYEIVRVENSTEVVGNFLFFFNGN